MKLSLSQRKMKRREHSGAVPWRPTVFAMSICFNSWPLLSIPLIWALATKTRWLSGDPILLFAMMLMPMGPPTTLVSLFIFNGFLIEHLALLIS